MSFLLYVHITSAPTLYIRIHGNIYANEHLSHFNLGTYSNMWLEVSVYCCSHLTVDEQFRGTYNLVWIARRSTEFMRNPHIRILPHACDYRYSIYIYATKVKKLNKKNLKANIHSISTSSVSTTLKIQEMINVSSICMIIITYDILTLPKAVLETDYTPYFD